MADLKEQIKALKKEHKEIEKEISELTEEIHSHPQWIDAGKRHNDADAKERQLYSEREKIAREVRERFCIKREAGCTFPYYTREPYSGTSTNIRPDILELIKKHIGPIYKLNSGDIEGVVRKLIQMALDKNEEYKRLSVEIDEQRKIEDETWKEREQIGNEIAPQLSWLIARKVHVCRELPKLEEFLLKPKSVKAHEERETLKEKTTNPEVIARIYSEIKSE